MTVRSITILLISLLCIFSVCKALSVSMSQGIKDGTEIPTFAVDLTIDPLNRWDEVIEAYKEQCLDVINFFESQIPRPIRGEILDLLNKIGEDLEGYIKQPYAQEIRGISAKLGVPLGEIVLVQFIYEFTSGCTSIVAQASDLDENQMMHGRNLDFGGGGDFTDELRNVTVNIVFTDGSDALAYSTQWAGYVGTMTGMSPGIFSISIDQYEGPWFEKLISSLRYLVESEENNRPEPVGFFVRDIIMGALSYSEAMDFLTRGHLTSRVYFIIAGSKAGQGSVITRERLYTKNVWIVDEPQTWYVLETNYDHWVHPPATDDRVTPAIAAMNEMGRDNLCLPNLYKVLSSNKVFNNLTEVTVLMNPGTGEYQAYSRNLNNL